MGYSSKDKKPFEELENWGDRKKTLFTNPNFVNIATKNLQSHLG